MSRCSDDEEGCGGGCDGGVGGGAFIMNGSRHLVSV